MQDAFNKLTKETTDRKAELFNYNAKSIVNGDSVETESILHVSSTKIEEKERGSGYFKGEENAPVEN
jgi:protein-tyrosine phosphatase